MTKKLLFLQLPLLDNDTCAGSENRPLAGMYLDRAISRAGLHSRYEAVFLPAAAEHDGDTALIERILHIAPAVIACTLYLWNVERTLRLLGMLRRHLPRVYIIAGGPEVAPDHPLLFRRHSVDIYVTGEGESAFMEILRCLDSGDVIDLECAAVRCKRLNGLPPVKHFYRNVFIS